MSNETPLGWLVYPDENSTSWYSETDDGLEHWLRQVELLGVPTYASYTDLPAPDAPGSDGTQRQLALVRDDATIYRTDGTEWEPFAGQGTDGRELPNLYVSAINAPQGGPVQILEDLELDASAGVSGIDASDLEGDAKMDDVLSTDGTDAYWTDPDSLLEGQESEIAVPALNYTEADSSFDSTGWLENTTGLPMEVRVVIDIDHGSFQPDLTFGGMATFHVNDSEQDNPILRRPFYFDGDRPVYNDTEDWEETLYYTVPSGKNFRTVVDHDADDSDFWVNLTTYTSEWVTE